MTPNERPRKRNVTVRIREDLLQEARKSGLNLSAFLELRLAEFLGGSAVSNAQIFTKAEENDVVMGPPRFELGISGSRSLNARPGYTTAP